MAEPFLGQIEVFAFGFAPRGWAMCAGQLLPISQNQALFAVLGTTYGGNGVTTFALPDLRGRTPMGEGNGPGLTPRNLGETPGADSHTLTQAEIAEHSHTLMAISNPNTANNVYTPDNTVALAKTVGQDANGASLVFNIYAADDRPNQAMDASSIGAAGGQAHSNMMPCLALSFCIALQGIFPSRN